MALRVCASWRGALSMGVLWTQFPFFSCGIANATSSADTEPPAPEIVVTAQKRNEEIKDVPFSVSAIEGGDIAGRRILDYFDITRTVPGVGLQAGQGAGLDNIEIRGVSSSSGAATVALYIDEVPITNSNAFDGAIQPAMFDLDRIEVLRGPQGTLYGASAMGGALRFITSRPDARAFEVAVSTDLSVTRHGGINNRESAVLNMSILEGVFAMRLGVETSDEEGYIDRYRPTPSGAGPGGSVLSLGIDDSTGVLDRRRVNDVHTQVVRLAGLYTLGDRLDVTGAVHWQRIASADSDLEYPALGQLAEDKRVAEPGTDVLLVPSLTVSARLGWAELTSVTGYMRRDFTRTIDGTFYNSYVFANDFIASPTDTPQQAYDTATRLAFLASPVYNKTTTDQWSQELRLTSSTARLGRLAASWTTGVFVSDQHQSHLNYQYIPGLDAAFAQIYGYGIDSSASPVGPARYPGVSYERDIIYVGNYYPTERQIAPFGQLEVTVTPQLKAAIGLRYVSARTSEVVHSGGFYGFGLPAQYSVTQRFHTTTPKMSVGYALDEKRDIYVAIAKGFRLGGPTGPDPANLPGGICDADYAALKLESAPTQYASDSLWSYELGSKGRYFDGRISVDAAVYAISWHDIQQTIGLPTCGFAFTTNMGNARSLGGEVEFRAVVTRPLTFTLNGGYTHAYISSVAPLAAGIVSVGESVLNVPRYTVVPGAELSFPVTDSTNVFAHAEFPYTGRARAYFASSGLPHQYSPGYGIVNVGLGITYRELNMDLYVKNLFNHSGVIQYPSVLSVPEGYTSRPVTIGLGVSWRL